MQGTFIFYQDKRQWSVSRELSVCTSAARYVRAVPKDGLTFTWTLGIGPRSHVSALQDFVSLSFGFSWAHVMVSVAN